MKCWSQHNPVEFKASSKLYGDGEEKFKWELELDIAKCPVKLMGPSAKFDIADALQNKWEVKSIEGSDKVRSSADGATAAGPFIEELLSILVQGRSFIRDAQSSVDSVFDPVKENDIIQFFERSTESVMSREVSSGIFSGNTRYYKVGLRDAISVCSGVVSAIRESYGDIEITFNGRKKSLDPVRAANIFYIMNEEFNSDFTCLRHLKNKSFFNFQSFDSWIQSKNIIDPRDCFDVDYVVLVNSIGYDIIEKENLHNRFSLYSISQNRPCFKIS